MKPLRLFSVVLGLLAAGDLQAADTGRNAARTVVVFDHPENFTDVKDSSLPTERGRDEILGRIRDYLVAQTASLLPDGDRMTITFRDIDLAGDFEPGRGPRFNEVRIVRDVYPPAMRFTYVVNDATGRVIKSGTADLRDLDFQMDVVLDTNDSLRYEKHMLSEWARSTLGGLKKG